MVKVREIYAPFEGATKGGQSMVAVEWCGRMVGGCVPLHREQSGITMCVEGSALWRWYSRAGHHLYWPVTGDTLHPLEQFPRGQGGQ